MTLPATLRHTCAGCRLHWAENATARMSAIAKGCVSQYKVHLQSYIGIFNCWIVVGLLLLFLRCGRRSVVVHQHSPNLNLRVCVHPLWPNNLLQHFFEHRPHHRDANSHQSRHRANTTTHNTPLHATNTPRASSATYSQQCRFPSMDSCHERAC